LDETFGQNNRIALISFIKTSSASTDLLPGINDFLLWYAKDREFVKFRQPYQRKEVSGEGGGQYRFVEEANGFRRNITDAEVLRPSSIRGRVFRYDNMTSQRPPGDFPVGFNGQTVRPRKGYWKTGEAGVERLAKANRLALLGSTLSYVRYIADFPVFPLTNVWDDTVTSGFGDPKTYVVQTLSKVIERCILMAPDPGDLVLDPTCGSGTTA
jgi:adenine-specific DNA-methyltransferase